MSFPLINLIFIVYVSFSIRALKNHLKLFMKKTFLVVGNLLLISKRDEM